MTAARMMTVVRTSAGPASVRRPEVLEAPWAARWTTWLALAAGVSGALTLWPGVLHGPEVMQGSARGTAVVTLVVALPTLLAGRRATCSGSARALTAWLGAAAYLTYNAVLFLFATPFNRAFPAYVALLGTGIATLITLVPGVNAPGFAARCDAALPARRLGAFVAVVAVANALVWLAALVPAIVTDDPAFLDGTGLLTNPVHVQDLAFWLPVMGYVAILARRRPPEGLHLLGAGLVFWLIEAVGVATDQWLGSRADPSSDVATLAGAVVFLALAAVTAVAVCAFERHVDY